MWPHRRQTTSSAMLRYTTPQPTAKVGRLDTSALPHFSQRAEGEGCFNFLFTGSTKATSLRHMPPYHVGQRFSAAHRTQGSAAANTHIVRYTGPYLQPPRSLTMHKPARDPCVCRSPSSASVCHHLLHTLNCIVPPLAAEETSCASAINCPVVTHSW